MIRKNKVLVIDAHPYDEVLGCGGSLVLHKIRKDEISVIFMSNGVSSRSKENYSEIIKRKKMAQMVCKKLNSKNAFFLDFPREVEEAATIDGCSKMQIFFRIIIPLSGPAIASAAIFQTVWIWNEFLLALIMLTSDEVKTLPLGLMKLRGEWSSDWPSIMAGLTIAILPVLIVFLIFQKYFVRSLAGLGK